MMTIKIYNKNTEWFIKTYNNLINKGKRRGLDKSKLDGYFEKHHIIPKCMGGTDTVDNYVLLTYREHIIAHRLLYRIYPDITGNLISLYAMALCNNKHKRDVKSLPSRFIEDLKKEYISKIDILSRQQLGKEVSSETRNKISKANTGRKVTEEAKEKLKKSRYTVKVITPTGKIYNSLKECAEDLKLAPTTLKDWVHNKPEKGYRVYGTTGRHSFSKRVIDPNGIMFNSISSCALEHGVDYNTMVKWIEKYPDLGYKYID